MKTMLLGEKVSFSEIQYLSGFWDNVTLRENNADIGNDHRYYSDQT